MLARYEHDRTAAEAWGREYDCRKGDTYVCHGCSSSDCTSIATLGTRRSGASSWGFGSYSTARRISWAQSPGRGAPYG